MSRVREVVRALGLAAVCGVLSSEASAQDMQILVAPKDSAAAATAEKQADDKGIFFEKKLFKAFERAAAHLARCGGCTVTLKVAAGSYTGKASTGTWRFPDTVAPQATLRILGGYDKSFRQRAPFSTPTVLVTTGSRSAPVITFEGKKHALKELVLSGLTLDAAPGNRYDARTSSLLKGSSSSWSLLAFGYLSTERLVIADNVFLNAAHGVAAPIIRAASPKAEVVVTNNVFLNNVFTWQVKSASGKHLPARYELSHNSFILGWPYNPDPTTSNPGTLELGNKYAAARVDITGNLFAFNIGGAIFPNSREDNLPKLSIQDNLFYGNGMLFGASKPGQGAVVGKFNRSAKHAIFDTDAIEEDFSWEVRKNAVHDPELVIDVPKLKAVSYKQPGTAQDEAASESQEEAGDGESLDMEDLGVDGNIRNYAPRVSYSPERLPFPQSEKARAYGAAPARVQQF